MFILYPLTLLNLLNSSKSFIFFDSFLGIFYIDNHIIVCVFFSLSYVPGFFLSLFLFCLENFL